jgi:hypothetical protein
LQLSKICTSMNFLLAVLIGLTTWTYAETPPMGQCAFLGVKKSDRVGLSRAHPDGKPDAVFSLGLAPPAGALEIVDMELRAVAGPPGVWKVVTGTPGVGFMGIAKAAKPSQILNRQGGPFKLDPKKNKHLLLFVTDDGSFSRKDRAYELKVVHSDGSSWAVPVKTRSTAAARAPSPSAAAYPVRMSAFLDGISRYDAVQSGKKIAGDDKADGLIGLTVKALNKEITAIEVRNVNGQSAVWDTVPGSGNPAVGVALASEPTRLLNNRNSSVRIAVKEQANLNLYLADNGSIRAGKTDFRVTVTFRDGEIAWCPVNRSPRGVRASPAEEQKRQPTVNFLGTWLGFVTTDAVGKYAEMKPDLSADTVFGLDIEVSPDSELTGIEVTSLGGAGQRWGTANISPGNWGLGVAYKSAPLTLLNKTDGSIRIPVGKRTQFYLYAADPGDIAQSSQGLRIIVHLADGSSYQQLVRRPWATTSSVRPGADDRPRAMGLITCEFRGFIADLVNTSTKPGKDGYLDGTLILKRKVERKDVAKITVKDGSGAVRWSSTGKAPAMFLGVALYPKIYQLVNPKGGDMKIPVSGRRTLYLYAADNGLLSDAQSRLSITVTFTDKTTLFTDVIK